MARKVSTRTARLRELAQINASNRCDHCRDIFRGRLVEDCVFPGRFCSMDCFEAAQQVAAMTTEAKQQS